MRIIKTTIAALTTSTLMLSYTGAAMAHDGPVFVEEKTSSSAPYIAAGLLLGLMVVGGVLVALKKKGGNKSSPVIESMVDGIKDGLEGIGNKLKNIEDSIDKHINDENEHNI